MDSFFIYREPFEEVCHCYTQPEQPSAVSSLTALNGREGFVIAPFSCHTNDKVYLLDGPKGTSLVLPLDGSEGFEAIPEWQDDTVFTASSIASREDYHNDFCRFHSELERSTFRKLVLARSVIEQKDEHMSPRDIFLNACSRYPRSYIALFYTQETGMWLIASPEILLRGDANGYQTMALAGTMRYEGEDMRWSDKNREEQQLVTDYIRTCLQPFAMEVTECEPYTTRAAHLAHLRTDFRFLLKDRQRLGTFLSAFHPTPAVCGIPKDKAQQFILSNEQLNRGYYSGFSGLLGENGTAKLYVTLRCMQLSRSACRLYAGGGLLKDSIEENEWLETESKLGTMRKLLIRD